MVSIFLRSLLFNVLFYFVLVVLIIIALPTLAMFVVFQKRIIESIKTSGIK